MPEPLALTVEPESAATVAGTSVLVGISPEESDSRWKVRVVFTRPDNAPPMRGEEVEVELMDTQGVRLKPLERAAGNLVEAGGSLGNSANADFSFQASNAAPASLQVRYQGQTAKFRITGPR